MPATGPKGNVTKGDVVAALADKALAAAETVPTPAAAAAADPPRSRRAPAGREERVKMTRLRKRIAERLKEAQNTAAMLTTFNEVDMTATIEMRARYQDAFTKKHGIKLGFMGFFVKAAVEALKAYPAVNSEIDGDEVVYKHHYDIGVAVSTEQGLVVPGGPRRRAAVARRHREGDRRPRQARPRRQARHGGPATAARSPSPTAACSARC